MALLCQSDKKKVTRTQAEHKVTHKCFSELSAEEISRNAYIWNLTLGDTLGAIWHLHADILFLPDRASEAISSIYVHM